MKRKFLVTVLVASLTYTPVQAQNLSSCLTLQSEQVSVMADIAQLLVQYPGTNIVIGICGKIADDEYRSTGSTSSAVGAFSACAFLGCALAGFDNCINVAKRWVLLSLRAQEIEKQRRELSCN